MAFSDQSTLLLDELSGLKDQMMENLDKVVERDQKVKVSKQRANSLVEQSNLYGTRTKEVRNKMRRRKYCYIIIGIVVLVSVILILLFSICGITFDKCGAGD